MNASIEDSPLFEPTRLGAIELSSRIVMAPMTRSRATPDGVASPLAVTYYEQRASAGLIITEGTQPSYQGQGYCRTPGLHTAEQVVAFRAVTDAVHASGGKIALQIMHVGRVGHSLNQFEKVGFVAPSAIAADAQMFTDEEGMQPMATPREMTQDDIDDVIEQHRVATGLALEAGFDGVELHGANGYLGQQFLSTGSNRRTDAYGGSADKRARFVLEVLGAMTEVAGADRVGLRLSPGGELNEMKDDDPADTYGTLLRALKGRGLAWVHFMQTGWAQETLYDLVDAPLILTGGYDGPKADDALRTTKAAAIGFGRPFLANPDLPERLRHGHPLNAPKGETFFSPGPEGYTDYPTFGEVG